MSPTAPYTIEGNLKQIRLSKVRRKINLVSEVSDRNITMMMDDDVAVYSANLQINCTSTSRQSTCKLYLVTTSSQSMVIILL